MPTIRLGEIAYARSGDKGSGANVGVIARSTEAFGVIRRELTAERVAAFFAAMQPGAVRRYELPNLGALNFLLPSILGDGGGASLRTDAQGKALGQALLEIVIETGDERRGAG